MLVFSNFIVSSGQSDTEGVSAFTRQRSHAMGPGAYDAKKNLIQNNVYKTGKKCHSGICSKNILFLTLMNCKNRISPLKP